MEQWSLAMGNWVHQWLRHIIPSGSPESFTRLGHDLPARVQQAAVTFRAQIATLLGEMDQAVPDWWMSAWNNASYMANLFAHQVVGQRARHDAQPGSPLRNPREHQLGLFDDASAIAGATACRSHPAGCAGVGSFRGGGFARRDGGLGQERVTSGAGDNGSP